MAEFDVTTGFDAHVREGTPAQNNALVKLPQIKGGTDIRYVFLQMPLSPDLAGKTVLSATLSCAVQTSWIDQVITAQAADASWNAATLTWDTKPGVTGPTATSSSTGALTAGQRFTINVTALVQAIADGQPNYGWRLSTSQTTTISYFRGFDYGTSAWTLNVETSDVLVKPTHLAPIGVIGAAKPILLVDDLDSLTAIQVQIDPASDAVSPDFDSGWVAVTKAQLDLSATAYGGLADGSTTYWRARQKTTNGSVSEWSDWVSITRAVTPSIVDDSGTSLYDPTPQIAAHLSPAGDAETRWRVVIHAVGDPTDVRYDSGDAITGATLSLEVPLRWNGRQVFPSDGNYVRVIDAWDRTDRVPSFTDNPFARLSSTVTQAASGGVTVPNTLTTSQVGIDVLLHWTRASKPPRFDIWRDGEILTTVEADDVEVSSGVYEWTDTSANPNAANEYAIRAVTGTGSSRTQSAFSPTSTTTPSVTGGYIRLSGGDIPLRSGGPYVGITAKKITKRQTFTLPYAPSDVDIVTSVGNLEGEINCWIDAETSTDLDADVALLEGLRENPQREVRLVWGVYNINARLFDLSPVQIATGDYRSLTRYEVTAGFRQIPEAD